MKPFGITSVLAPTDLSDAGIPALRYARLFADQCGARLTVMYTDPIVYPLDFAGPTEAYHIAATPEHLGHLREEVEQHARDVMAGREFEFDVTVGQPAAAILAAAREKAADLIVMATHARRGWRRALLGSVTDGVLHGSDFPVLIVARQDVPGALPYAVTNILCPVNFSEVARASLLAAASLARTFAAHLTIVHVIESDETTDVTADEERIRLWVGPEIQEMCSYRELVVHGGAAERVIDGVEDLGADLLVIGAQHRLFRDETVIGTTTERLIRFSPCPVLVVPRETSPHSAGRIPNAGEISSPRGKP